MRRNAGLLLVFLGAFFVVAGPMVKWYLAPHAAKAPIDRYSSSVAVSDGQSVVLDQGTLTIRKGLTVTAFRQVRGDSAAGNAQRAVWEEFLLLRDASNNTIDATTDRVAFDRVSGMAINCCNEQVDGDAAVLHTGLSYKFPFDTAKRDYQHFDTKVKKAFTMAFKGVESRDGMSLYHFVEQIPPSPLEAVVVPPSLVGLTGDSAIQVYQFISNTREVWVEPTTGIIVYGREHPVQTLRDETGKDLLTVADINLGFTAETEKMYADEAKSASSALGLLRTTIPLVLLIVGLLAVNGGFYLVRRANVQGAASASGGGSGPSAGQPRTIDLTKVEQQSDVTLHDHRTDYP